MTDDGDLDMGRAYRFLAALRRWYLLVPSELSGMRKLIGSSKPSMTQMHWATDQLPACNHL